MYIKTELLTFCVYNDYDDWLICFYLLVRDIDGDAVRSLTDTDVRRHVIIRRLLDSALNVLCGMSAESQNCEASRDSRC
jgi:hypothetical protein